MKCTDLRIGAWNIDGLAPNKLELETLIKINNLDIILISETHFTDRSLVVIPGYTIYHTNHPDGKAHAGSAVIIKNNVKHHSQPCLKSAEIQATTVCIEDKNGFFNVSSVYCPPKPKIKEEFFSGYFSSLGPRFIAGGDWNAKHLHWGSRLITSRGHQLKGSIDKNKLNSISTYY